jgi:fructose 1,6-bisphosphatase
MCLIAAAIAAVLVLVALLGSSHESFSPGVNALYRTWRDADGTEYATYQGPPRSTALATVLVNGRLAGRIISYDPQSIEDTATRAASMMRGHLTPRVSIFVIPRPDDYWKRVEQVVVGKIKASS